MAYSKTASLAATRATLDEYGLRAKYKMGQNFLIDDTVVGRIVDLAKLDPNEAVIEVGPGIGTLTSALLPRVGAVVAIEADSDMRGPLSLTCADYSERMTLIQGDALRVNSDQVIGALRQLRDASGLSVASDVPRKVVANLPYAVAAKLILQWLERWDFIDSMTVMVQQEVADRIAAAPGSKAYGAYTLKLRLHARVTGRFEVPHDCFFPAPHVESAVIRIDRLPADELLAPAEAHLCAEVIDAAFSQRRKTIRNTLSRQGYSREVLDEALAAAEIDPGVRAETLGRDDFIRLARLLAKSC